MNIKIYNLVLVALFVVIISACTTTTKTLSREVSVSSEAEVNNAKIAFNQKNYTVAAKLLKPLAEQGRGDAQYALGYLYFNGLGVPVNKSLAAQWFNSAAANGNENAKQALRHLPSSDKSVIDLRDDTTPVLATEEAPTAESITVESNIDQPPKAEKMAIEATDDVNKLDNGVKFTDGEKWITEQPANHFTIQLIVLSDESALQKFINENNLQEKSVYYRIQKNGKTFYALVHGSFESYSLAKKAVTGMSSKLKSEDPWIRKITNIQKLLSAR